MPPDGVFRITVGMGICIGLLGAFPPVDFRATCFLGGEPLEGFGEICFCLTMAF